ncbi:hypothetical protein KC353_g17853 [Hortaea werneckii]|uniref:Pre-mRNA polyadenylation factor Fip1 domain-containing protein n=1 Tax=Hortaea werneckii TaxID=91943 RepID=A0A3M7CDY0_HORWE|nr:hypothetical protein KC353_g17853 [Hortaea werneckii]RMY50342.1 hypothetical protein D0865_06962 [Hortaea werneckii]
MEEEDDDFYGGGERQQSGAESTHAEGPQQVKMEQMDTGGDGAEEEEEEEEEDEDDVQFTLDKPTDATKAEPSRPSVRPTPSQDKTATTIKAEKSGTPVPKQERSGSAAPVQQPQTTKGSFTYAGKEGKDFPEIRTSHLDLNTIPQWPASNGPPKLLTDLDIDADLAEHSKPWRLPGTDQTDFFNYGFDEYTWTQYCLKQQSMAGQIGDMKAMDAQMKAMFGGGGGGPPPGMGPGGPPGGGGGGGGGGPGGIPPGMPGPEQMMQMMMQSGQDPSSMDFNQFMGMMGGGGPQGGQSPMPGAGQGFQPPSGPSAGPDAMMGMMGDHQQGGGGGRGGRRGRGRW